MTNAVRLIEQVQSVLERTLPALPEDAAVRPDAEKVLDKVLDLTRQPLNLNHATPAEIEALDREAQRQVAKMLAFRIDVATDPYVLNDELRAMKGALNGLGRAAPDLHQMIVDKTQRKRMAHNWPKDPDARRRERANREEADRHV